MKTINHYIVVDTQSVLGAYPDPSQDSDKPTQVSGAACYLIQAAAGPKETQEALALVEKTNEEQKNLDLVVFRTVSLSGNSGTSSILYDVAPASGGLSFSWNYKPAKRIFVRTFERDVLTPLPMIEGNCNLAPPQFDAVQTMDYGIVGFAFGGGKRKLGFRFYLTRLDDRTGAPVLSGYFQWNGSIA